jgi:thioredoxin
VRAELLHARASQSTSEGGNAMLNRRHLLSGLALSAVLLSGRPAAAVNKTPFDMKAFEAAQAAGKSILIDVFASWCPICARQRPILASLLGKPKFKDMAYFEVDFDSQKDALRALRVQRQSTLITFKGANETGRSTGVTNPAGIEGLLDKAI